jgi:cytochrome c
MARMPKSAPAVFLVSLLALLPAARSAHAALTWPTCPELTTADFKAVPLATRAIDGTSETMKMAFDLLAQPTEDAKGKVDVYFTERLGKVRKFDSKTGKVITLATIPLNVNAAGSSDGVMGIALDPRFKTNHLVYLYYSSIAPAEKAWRVSRFALNAAHDKLDLTTETVVLKIPILGGSKHPGGALQFDGYGDLWITTGNDYGPETEFPVYSSPNTNDLRGKILRIHPTADGKYIIPTGNLFPPGTALTRPEIYIMGNRNPYTLSLDPVRRWAVWGDIGPDNLTMDGAAMNTGGAEKTEEYDLAKAPGNYGYPFFSGDFATKAGTNPEAPVMPDKPNWANSTPGMLTLPKAIAPIYAYKKSCAITGPIYRYDGELVSTIKFPPHFNRKWLVSDYNGDNNKIKAFTLSDDGTRITAEDNAIGILLHSPLDMQMGPDGALYVNNYDGTRAIPVGTNTGIIRIEYTGSCHPMEPVAERVPDTSKVALARWDRGYGPSIEILRGSVLSVSVKTTGPFSVDLTDLHGRTLSSLTSVGDKPVSLAGTAATGVYLVRVTSGEGTRIRKIIRD